MNLTWIWSSRLARKVTWIRDESAMNLTCRFHVGQADSWRFHGTFIALSPCHFHGAFISLPLQIQALTWPKGKVPWKRHESAMKVSWNCLGGHVWGWNENDTKVTWKCHESAMKVPWKWGLIWIWHEYVTVDFEKISWENSWRFPLNYKIVEINYIIFISDSCQIHVTFMPLSTKQSSKQFHGMKMADSWHFPLKTISKLS